MARYRAPDAFLGDEVVDARRHRRDRLRLVLSPTGGAAGWLRERYSRPLGGDRVRFWPRSGPTHDSRYGALVSFGYLAAIHRGDEVGFGTKSRVTLRSMARALTEAALIRRGRAAVDSIGSHETAWSWSG